MKQYRFEIVRRGSGRYSWIFVVEDDDGPRVLARSARSYRSQKRVRRAIDALRDAPICDATGPGGFPLPATSFQLIAGVLPLLVEESPVEYQPVAVRRGSTRRDIEEEESAAQQAVLEEEESAAQQAVLEEEESAAQQAVLEEEESAAQQAVLEEEESAVQQQAVEPPPTGEPSAGEAPKPAARRGGGRRTKQS